AYVRVLVEDTTFHKWRRRPSEPRIRLRIADCSNEISLWFELSLRPARESSLYKIDALLGALQRFRAALDAEAELYAHREQHRRRLCDGGRERDGYRVEPRAHAGRSQVQVLPPPHAAGLAQHQRPSRQPRPRYFLALRALDRSLA